MTVALEAVSFRYPATEDDALRDVSLEFAPGRLTLITGRLGAGCSTLLLAMAGLAPHVTGGTRRGMVHVLGHDPATSSGREALAGRIGLLLPTQATQLSGMAFTVRDEVAFGPANLGWSRARIGEEVQRALTRMDIAHLADRDPRTLSGGELQRVVIAGILVMTPEVLLLDEPTLELDPESAAMVYGLLPQLATQATVVLASADLDRAVEIADRVVLLDRGKVLADGAPAEVLADPRAVGMGCSTTAAEISRAAGLAAPYPLTVGAAVAQFGS